MKERKTRRGIIALGLCLLSLMGGLILWFSHGPTIDRQAKDALQPVVSLPDPTGSNVVPIKPLPVSDDPQTPPTGKAPSRSKEIQSAAQALNVPVDFWGKVVDQNSNVIVQAKIVARVRQWSGRGTAVRPGFVELQRESDGAGVFEITGAKGDSLRIESIIKDGYVLSSKAQTSFGYNISTNHLPDRQNPVVFRLWKSGSPQQLVSHRLSRLGIPSDGTAQHFDLIAQ